MYNDRNMREVEHMIKEQGKHDLSVGNFATISGIKGKQFGREIYSTVIPFKDLMDFLSVFPDVQRDMLPRRVKSIKNYVLSGLDDSSAMRFFSAITATCRGNMFYDANTQKVAIDTKESKMSINDGQHRFYGISEAIRELQSKLNKAKDEDKRQELSYKLKELKNMVIPIVIFNQITETEEKQLSHDLNKLAQRLSRSSTIKLAQTDYLSRMAREISEENRYMKHYGVEMNKVSIHANNPNTILLTTVYAGIKELLLKEFKVNRNFITAENYEGYKKYAENTFNSIFQVLPPDLEVKGKYILEKNYALKGIMRFVRQAKNVLDMPVEEIYETIGSMDWTTNVDAWKEYGGAISVTGTMIMTGDGIGSVYNALMDKATTKGIKSLV